MLRKSLLCASLLLAGCDPDSKQDADSFREGLPSKQMVEVASPGPDGQGLTAASAENQTSEYYVLTVAAAASINGGTLGVLGLIEAIVKHPPSSIQGDVAVWGPHTEALSPITWKLTVTRTDDDTYGWVLAAKAKIEPDTNFKTVLAGSHTAAVDDDGERRSGYGSGQFLIDWEKNNSLPGNEGETGVATMEIRYARTAPNAVASVEADFQVDAGGGTLASANYRFKQAPGTGGELDYVVKQNIDVDPTRSKLEKLSIKSRWERTGLGRSDIKLSGGDLFGEATINECWDSNFRSAYHAVSYNPAIGYGTVSACGSFSTAVYSTL
ncbi:hypothetical protein HUA74_05215 [Myxococcus sp. CA051A]|uniref:Lipoprotein n=1 Tax=Myxococcus llanfairpwllgwyngyllgogerychwyrndrobwllllantysiliogogogochensis TaxID=2590453 RepID=A0A540WWU9_9BACT|nr:MULTISPECIES: hypothetical protein [Myxococcus]NTX15547.1 hypothetical protein [Myxococcus sp. CA056]NTX32881.1 hypothetical protein [Myxococcus sp. CA033]NTX55112.1 hypothetical protein [Myxococcus sp. CA039A]NTX60053.1 hypothetical protein [Myxococcus sp. CA051A]TQF13473.1 hypothetical protein FJV41_23750 [Myxococcus llanfairpwllgwyngyllgogerychwyrndrobwllllantysiliogogogochensis]